MTTPQTKPKPVPKIGPAPKHKWTLVPTYVHQDKTVSGCNETERECQLCGLVKITVHTPTIGAYRAWRTKKGVRSNCDGRTPVCDGSRGEN